LKNGRFPKAKSVHSTQATNGVKTYFCFTDQVYDRRKRRLRSRYTSISDYHSSCSYQFGLVEHIAPASMRASLAQLSAASGKSSVWSLSKGLLFIQVSSAKSFALYSDQSDFDFHSEFPVAHTSRLMRYSKAIGFASRSKPEVVGTGYSKCELAAAAALIYALDDSEQ
jgi:hypothetical protein